MIRVDERSLDFDKIKDHIVARSEAVVKYSLHDIVHLRLQLVVAREFWQLNFQNESSELLVDKCSTVQTWFEETSDLLTNEYFKGAFRDEETWTHGGCIFDSCLNVLLSEILKGINLIDDILKDLVEYIVDTGAAKHLSCNVTNEATLKFLAVLFAELGDEIQNDWPHALLVYLKVHRIIGKELTIFLLDS